MLREIKCKYCDAKFSVQDSANFSVICSHCKRLSHLECEYGFGPVTPCRIYLGEPYDRPLKIQHASYDGEILEIIFNRGNLLIYNPVGITSTEQELRIEEANKIKWIYLPDGDIRETSVTTITYILEAGKLIKNSKYRTEQQTLKESVDAVYLGEWQWDE